MERPLPRRLHEEGGQACRPTPRAKAAKARNA
jgi:hypothetical protein